MTRVLFAGGQLFDGTGADPAPADVAVEGGRFTAVGSGLDGDEVVDCTGSTLLPGLFDCHVHVMISGVDPVRIAQTPFSYPFYQAIGNLRATLDAGITTVRDAGGADLGLKQAVADGLVAGPRMQISISMLSQTGGHADGWMPSGRELPLISPHPGRPATIADGPAEVRRVVRELVRAGADVIKVATSGGVLSPRDDPRHGQFRDEEVAVMVAEATAAGIWVMAHAQATEGIKVAVRNGVRSVEHGVYLDDEAISMMLDRGTWLVPTLAAPRAVLELAAAGVRVAMGTDSGVGAHGDNLGEIALMVQCGMTPAAALHATTGSAAELLGVAGELGTVRPGKRADLVVVDGSPLDVETLRNRVRAVYQDGRLVSGDPAAPARTTAPSSGSGSSAPPVTD